MNSDTEVYKKLLEEEKEKLVEELKTVGRINPDNISDWEAVLGEINIDPAEIEERASEITQFEDQSAVEYTLEVRLNEVLGALRRIDDGTYGICHVCQHPIEEARLRSNLSATTCKEHMA